jgi:hypothetical protein
MSSLGRQIRDCIVHNEGLADIKLANASSALRGLGVEVAPYWSKHAFDLRYYSLGDDIHLTPHTTIAMLHYLNEFAVMLSSHLMVGRWGDAVFDERIDAACPVPRRGLSIVGSLPKGA